MNNYKTKILLIIFSIVAVQLIGKDNTDAENLTSNLMLVETVSELQSALLNAKAGDEIVILSGTYVGEWEIRNKNAVEGNPITIRSQSSDNPAVLKRNPADASMQRVLSIYNSSYIDILNIDFTGANQGIFLDECYDIYLYGLKVYSVGQEAIHLARGSSYNLIDNCHIYYTGNTKPGYGEAIYVGSANSNWDRYGYGETGNEIRNCIFGLQSGGGNIRAEHIDIKEGTTNTIVEGNTFYGDGMSGENSANSFIEDKGNNALINGNIFFRQNESNINQACIRVQDQLNDGVWGHGCQVYYNTFYFDDDITTPLVSTETSPGYSDATASNNSRIPTGKMYEGNVTEF
jgi:hypothetical protein